MKINQYNDDFQREGYWEVYWDNGKTWRKGYYNNGTKIGCWLYYHSNGTQYKKAYFI